MEADSNLYQNSQFDYAGVSGPVKFASTVENVKQMVSEREKRPEPRYPKIDTLKEETDLG